jgi:very-short-patch-repair endonuclease
LFIYAMDNFQVDRTIAALAARQYGHVTREQLLEAGLTRGLIDTRLKKGRLIQVHRGVYAVGHRRIEPLARAKAAVLAGGPGAILSFSSAAFLWGLTTRLALPPELTVKKDRRIAGLRIHTSNTLAHPDIKTQHGIRTTSPARTILDIAPTYNDDQLTRAVNDARHSRYLNLSDLAELLNRLPHAPAAARLRPFVDTPTGITRSMFEDAFLRFVRHFELPVPDVNVMLGGYLVDALFKDHRLIVELDGWDFHNDRHSFETDRERDAAMLALGYVTVRITWERLTQLSRREATRLKKILADRQPGTSLDHDRF